MMSVLLWYLVLTMIGLAAAPVAMRLLGALPTRGLLLARPLGVLLFGYLFWLLWSVGLLPNDAGGAWLALGITAAVGLAAWRWLRPTLQNADKQGARLTSGEWVALAIGELLFILAFGAWALVRSHDPAASHTEQPMDLMFMSSLWASPTWPPQDAWLSGYPIAYYYMGYWLLTSVGRLAGTPPEIAYTVGQAAWFGLLSAGSFGLAWMLLRLPRRGEVLGSVAAAMGALLAAIWVAAAGNVQWVLEWLHAQGVNVAPLATWAQVRGFPEGVPQSGVWYIGGDWWWWRSSRVLADAGANGGHQEVIAEFPAFSYVLGDNHPHVLGMPIVLVVLALALAWYWRGSRLQAPPAAPTGDAGLAKDAHQGAEEAVSSSPDTLAATASLSLHEDADRHKAAFVDSMAQADPPPEVDRIVASMPPYDEATGGWWSLPVPLTFLSALALGSLIFLNTWDFPAYWGLMTLAVFGGAQGTLAARTRTAALFAVVSLAGSLLFVLPYLLTAQSQADGIALNFFNPTRLPQFLWVALAGLLGAATLIVLAWRELRPATGVWLGLMAATVLLPLLLLAGVFSLLNQNPEFLAANPLAEGATQTLSALVWSRWRQNVWTLALTGLLLATLAALWLRRSGRPAAEPRSAAPEEHDLPSATPFVLLLAGVGMMLYWAPEILFLRDNFGWRMNTIFKFYYQAWLLLALAGAWSVTQSLARLRREPLAALLALPAVALVLAGAYFLPAGARAKTGGFAHEASFDASAWLQAAGPGAREAALWLRANTPRDSVVAEAAGDSYRSDLSRISTLSGRPTLLGWMGHQRQWRGDAYGEMAAGREEALRALYRTVRAEEIPALLATWGIDYVVVGPSERQVYEMAPQDEARIASVLPLVFESSDTRIYAAR
jgi:uncharacterized membrane protein